MEKKLISGRFKRKRHATQTKLTEDDITYLVKNTRYNENEIKEWFRYIILQL